MAISSLSSLEEKRGGGIIAPRMRVTVALSLFDFIVCFLGSYGGIMWISPNLLMVLEKEWEPLMNASLN